MCQLHGPGRCLCCSITSVSCPAQTASKYAIAHPTPLLSSTVCLSKYLRYAASFHTSSTLQFHTAACIPLGVCWSTANTVSDHGMMAEHSCHNTSNGRCGLSLTLLRARPNATLQLVPARHSRSILMGLRCSTDSRFPAACARTCPCQCPARVPAQVHAQVHAQAHAMPMPMAKR